MRDVVRLVIPVAHTDKIAVAPQTDHIHPKGIEQILLRIAQLLEHLMYLDRPVLESQRVPKQTHGARMHPGHRSRPHVDGRPVGLLMRNRREQALFSIHR